jgi:hypothetical protein
MNTDSITQLLVELHGRLTGREPPIGLSDAIDQARADCDLGADEDVPGWMTQMFRAVLNQTPTGQVRFPRVGTDAASFLDEMAELLGWEYDNSGEDIAIEFAPLEVSAFISNESLDEDGRHCSSYKVVRCRDE